MECPVNPEISTFNQLGIAAFGLFLMALFYSPYLIIRMIKCEHKMKNRDLDSDVESELENSL